MKTLRKFAGENINEESKKINELEDKNLTLERN
jgi:hypothetical protein